jgi:hypothetical protein
MTRSSFRLSLGELLIVVVILAVLFATLGTALRRARGPALPRPPVRRLDERSVVSPERLRTHGPIHANSRTATPSGPATRNSR